jgi:glycosyltransferase 2 family protein
LAETTFPDRSITRRLAFGLLFGFLVLLLLVLVSDLRQVSHYVLTFHWAIFPFVLILTLFNYTLRFVKWHFYLGQVGVHNLSVIESARLFLAGFPLAVTPGKVGEVLKGVWLNRACGLPVPRGIAVVIAERLSDGMGMLALSSLGVIAYPNYWPIFLALLAIMIALVTIIQIRPLALALLGWGEHLPLLKRFAHNLRDFYEGSYILFRPKAVLIAASLGTVSWLGEGVGFYLILTGLGVHPGLRPLSVAIFTLSFSIIIGAISTLPGGLGASEVTITGILTLLLGLSPGLSAAATLLVRFATLWFGVTLGLLTWVVSRHLIGLE